MNEPLSPQDITALKKEIFSSLHCALPGIVESFDAETQTAAIRPAVKHTVSFRPSSSCVIPSSSGVIPSSPGDIQSSSGDIPSSSGVIPSSPGDIQSSSGVIPSSPGVIPSSSGVIPSEVEGSPRRSDVFLPLLRDVPVFMPVPFPVSPGDPCLLVFADCDIDAWLESGEIKETASGRMHSLSDAFAFVGFTRRSG